jgi:cytochrome c oxidase subunit 2
MSLRTITGRRALGWVAVLAIVALVGCAKDYPQTTLLPRGDFARLADDLFSKTWHYALLVFIVVEGVLVYAMWHFRARPGGALPEQTHGNTTLEIVWTIIPAAILALIAVPTVRTIFQMAAPTGGDALQVEVIGHQWWWEFRYPGLKIVTANELHVPVGQTVNLQMTTADVIHSFWVPQFAAKRDVFPNRQNNLWFKAEVAGNFSGQCAEFCGVQHGRMGYRIISESPEEFQGWAARMQVGSPLNNAGVASDSQLVAVARAAGDSTPMLDSVLAKGKAAFMAGGCIGCHAMAGTPTAGITVLTGPNLSHVGSRTYIVAGMMKNTDENLARWLRNPQGVKEGSLMRLPRPLTDDEVGTLVAYLRAHR